MRTLFGIPLLDSLVEKGFPLNSFIVISGPVGVGKSFVLKWIITARVLSGEKVVVVTLDNDPMDVIGHIVEHAREYVGNITVLNGFGEGAETPKDLEVITLESLKPEVLLSRFEQLLRTSGVSLVTIDSLNEIILSLDPMTAISFVKALKRLTRKYNVLIITVLHTGIPGFEQMESLTYYLADGVVVMDYDPRFEEIGLPLRRIRILKLRSTRHSINWVPFQITSKGLEEVDVKAIMEKLRKTSLELMGGKQERE